jgi:hypothetical protein
VLVASDCTHWEVNPIGFPKHELTYRIAYAKTLPQTKNTLVIPYKSALELGQSIIRSFDKKNVIHDRPVLRFHQKKIQHSFPFRLWVDPDALGADKLMGHYVLILCLRAPFYRVSNPLHRLVFGTPIS